MNSEVKQLNEIKETSIKTEGYKEGHGTKEWSGSSLNIQKSKCSCGCKYCYMIHINDRFNKEVPTELTFNSKVINQSFKKRKDRMMTPTSYNLDQKNIEMSIKVYKKALKIGNELLITIKPSVYVTQRLIDELKEYKDQILFRFTITTTDQELIDKYEPQTPSLSERLHSLGLAKEAGFKTSVSIEPFLSDPIPTIEMVRLLVTDTIWVGPMSNPLAELKELYTYKNLSQIYDRLTHHPAALIIRLKNSYRKKLGIKE